MFSTYCSSFYGNGCQSWNFKDRNVSKVYTCWNKAVRTLFKLPWNCRTKYLSTFLDVLYISNQLQLRANKMYNSMERSHSHLLKTLYVTFSSDARCFCSNNREILSNNTFEPILVKTLPLHKLLEMRLMLCLYSLVRINSSLLTDCLTLINL